MLTSRNTFDRAALGAALLLLGGLGLAGCASGEADASTSAAPTPTVTVTETATPAPSATPTETETAATATIPTSCDEIGSAASRAATVDTLQPDPEPTLGKGLVGASVQVLGCAWSAGDVSNVKVFVAQPEPRQASQALTILETEGGYTCESAGTRQATCSHEVTKDYNGHEYTVMSRVVYRDGTWLDVSGSAVDVNALTDDTVKSIWG